MKNGGEGNLYRIRCGIFLCAQWCVKNLTAMPSALHVASGKSRFARLYKCMFLKALNIT